MTSFNELDLGSFKMPLTAATKTFAVLAQREIVKGELTGEDFFLTGRIQYLKEKLGVKQV